MTPRPDDWSDLADAWTAAGTPAPRRDLLRQVRRRDRLARINFWAEVGAAVLASGFIVWIARLRDAGWPMAATGLVFAGFVLALTVWARRAAPPVADDTPLDALKTAVQQARAGLIWAGCGVAISLATGVALAVIFALEPVTPRLALPTAVVTVGAVAAFVAGYALHIRRCRRRIAYYRRMLEELESGATTSASTTDPARPPETTSPPATA